MLAARTLLVAPVLLATSVALAPTASASLVASEWVTTPGSADFGCTHAAVDWTVPAGVSSVDVVASGASGSAASPHPGGGGARVTGTLPVTAGETLHVRVGCSDGFNGGGQTGALDGSGNGGGATDVRQGGDALANRVVTAAGGGGGGAQGAGGSAAGPTGGNGVGGLNDGIGATPSAGGARGGTLGQGGPGELMVGGGGGGGGVYGGGGSGYYAFCELCHDPVMTPGGGGGAGSSAGPAGSTIAAAPTSGDGSFALSWVATTPAAEPVATTTVVTDTPDPTAPDQPYSITATVTSANGPVTVGSVAFTGITAGTIVRPLQADGSTGPIVYSAQPVGTITIHASYVPGDGYLGSEADATHTVGPPPDTTAPSVTTSFPSPPASGWFTGPVTGSVTAIDDDAVAGLDCVGGTVSDLQGIGSDSATAVLAVAGEGPHTVSCTATDPAGNTGSSSTTSLQIDSIAPTLAWNGGPADGVSYVFGSVPAPPTCTAADGGSGPAGCAVTGYASTVGTHVLIATASDVAGNTTTETRTYTVTAWQLHGFFSPVDMGGVINTVKAGNTVPLKFEVFAGGVEQTSPSAIRSIRAVTTSCSAGAPQDEIEVTSAGDTQLRYDSGAGVFLYNWKTPRLAGTCLDLIVETLEGSTLVAHFRLR